MEETMIPEWVVNGKVDEQALIMDILRQNNLSCQNGEFYGINGQVSEERLREVIYKHLRRHYRTGLKEKVESILWAMRLELNGGVIHTEPNLIHVRNGTLDLDKDFYEYKHICQNRLPVNYDITRYNPQRWLAFLDQLLEPEDIDTLQEFMGYCLIPTNAAQKMLILLGDGGEGKSRVGAVMSMLLGPAMVNGSLDKIEHDRFARANLEGKLLMVDDDLNLDALKTTHHIKTIITADTMLDLERKGKQSYQGWLNCRFLCFGNGSLQALHDRSNGFYRRQIILTCKSKDPKRVDDPMLLVKFLDELEDIFFWCLIGLQRLRKQNFQFTISSHARENLRRAMLEGNNLVEFMESEGYFIRQPGVSTCTRSLYSVYCSWCNDNALKPFSMKAFSRHLMDHQQQYGIIHSNNIYIGGNRRARGFSGIRPAFT